MLDTRSGGGSEVCAGAGWNRAGAGWTHAGQVDWREADRNLRRIARARGGLDADEARWLLAAERAQVHRALGCATFAEYVERVLGYTPRVCADRLRVATALEQLPALQAALAAGTLPYSAVRELVRVATPDTERAWLAAGQGCTVREIEELVAGHRPGDAPTDPTEPDLRLRVLRLEVSPATFALFREVEQRIATRVGRPATDDEVVDAMCRAALAPEPARAGESADAPAPNLPPYQIALTVCAECDRAWQDGAGRAIEVGPAVVERARCDAQLLGRVDGTERARASRTIPPALRRQVLRRDHHRCVVPGCRNARWVEVHHVHERSRGGPNAADNLVTLCSAHHDAWHRGELPAAHLGTAGGALGPDPRGSGEVGRARAPAADEARAALRGLGFKSWESAAAVARALTHVGADTSLEALIRAALRAAGRPDRRC